MKNPKNKGFEDLFARLDQIAPHPTGLKEELIKISKFEEHTKNGIIVKPGETSRHCYYIIDGFVRLYHDYERKEVTTWFLHTGDFMIQQHGFYFELPSPEYIQATMDTTCLKLYHDDLRFLFKKYPIFKDTYIYLTQLYYFQLTQRDGTKAYKAEDKYRKLQEEYPYIIQYAQGAHIASYLGISEFHLSKIRNKRI